MKIRNGFVSNSSSSSFIVIFPKIPKSAEDVKEMLFDKDQEKYYGSYNGAYPVNGVAKTIWCEIEEQEINNFDKAKYILGNCSNYDYPDAPDYKDFKDSNGDYDWDKYNEAQNRYSENKLKEFFNMRKLKLQKLNKEDPDCVFYNFQFSDNDGSYYSALEHGELFKKLKHIKISNH